ncbi:DUF11 domain-containing protein [Streptomyces sp. NPDC004629]|uniref:DUF11 domain-containing protein n=1 Tax=Streptomyces sp. NPDC004629 TaxID=3364705 RepID=UPI0036A4EA06
MTKVRSGRLLAFALTASAAGGVLGLLGAPHAVAAEASADLSITKVGPTRTPDGRFGYQITVTNNGPDASSGWTVLDPMQSPADLSAPGDIRSSDPRCARVVIGHHGNVDFYALQCKGGPLAAGSSTVIEVTAAGGGPNRASVSGNEPDSNPANNAAASVPVEDIPLVDPVVGAGAAVAFLAAGGTVSLIRRRTTSA